jgi:hypothetical protein
MFKDAATLQSGGTLDIPIASAPGRPYFVVDSTFAMAAITGGVELSLISVQGRGASQRFTVTDLAGNPKAKQMSSGPVESDNSMVEVAVVRFSLVDAVNTAAILIEQAAKMGALPIGIEERFAALFRTLPAS